MTDERNKGIEDEHDDDGVYVIEDLDESSDDDSELRMEEAVSDSADPDAEEKLRSLKAENEELRDSYLRLRADFENYRKRLDREKSDYYRFALSGIVSELLPVLDNFERALSSAGNGGSEFVTGVELIHRQLADVLQKLGLEEIEAVGKPFDPNVHEAVARDDDPEVPSNTVTDVMQKGYSFQQRLLRPAMVRVAVGGPEPEGDVERFERDDMEGEIDLPPSNDES